MADPEAKKILGNLWADIGDRTDPDDALVTPVLSRTTGWPADYSASAGEVPKRRRVNQRFRELDGAAANAMRYGIEPWDTEVDYPQHAKTAVGRQIYSATVATGPSTGNATDPTTMGQTVWTAVTGTQGAPAAPSIPTATSPESGVLQWIWNCPLDNGAQITEFDFFWRVSGGSFSSAITITHPSYRLTGLTNGMTYEVQVVARNSIGDSGRSGIGSAVPSGTIPGGGATLALRAEGGDTEVVLNWIEPDNGGETITGYTVQWRESGQSFSTSRQSTVSTTNTTITSLTNGTVYFFQVRAVNSQGNGPWSNEASATPEDPPPPPPTPPADTAPIFDSSDMPTGTVIGSSILWEWPTPEDGGQRITGYQVQWREQGDSWEPSNIINLTEGCWFHQGLTENTTYELRVRGINSVGTGVWSGTGSRMVSASGSYYERTTAGVESFLWPWTATSAMVLTVGATGGSGGGGGGGGATGGSNFFNNGGGGGGGGSGGSGGASTVVVNGTTYTGSGGLGGGGGGGGGAGSISTTSTPTSLNYGPTNGEDGFYAGGGAGGTGGMPQGNHPLRHGANGGNGGIGEAGGSSLSIVTGLSMGVSFSITVGAGGSGGGGGGYGGGVLSASGNGSSGGNGSTGGAGSVRIVPIY